MAAQDFEGRLNPYRIAICRLPLQDVEDRHGLKTWLRETKEITPQDVAFYVDGVAAMLTDPPDNFGRKSCAIFLEVWDLDREKQMEILWKVLEAPTWHPLGVRIALGFLPTFLNRAPSSNNQPTDGPLVTILDKAIEARSDPYGLTCLVLHHLAKRLSGPLPRVNNPELITNDALQTLMKCVEKDDRQSYCTYPNIFGFRIVIFNMIKFKDNVHHVRTGAQEIENRLVAVFKGLQGPDVPGPKVSQLVSQWLCSLHLLEQILSSHF